jgi:hypothetical protein
MRPVFLSCVATLFAGLLALAPSRASADDAEPVKQKLFEAKKAFDVEAKKFQKAVTESLDKREEDARTAGNKKMVDLIKAERTAFEKTGEHPSMMPTGLVNQMAITRANLDTAYTVAVKDFLKLKLDDAAAAAEKEQTEIKLSAGVLYGRRTYVSTLKASDIKSASGNPLEKETNKAKMDGQVVPHSLFMHPERTYANASFPLSGKPIAFRATIGVPNHADYMRDPASPLTFEVIGDGLSLWKSEPVTKLDTFQKCVVRIEKVKTLTLRVHCAEANNYAHAVWFAPVVVE